MGGKLIRDFLRPRGTRTKIENVRLVNPAVARNFLIPFSSRINGFPRARDPSKSPRRGLRNLASYSYGRDRFRFSPANARSRESLVNEVRLCRKKIIYALSISYRVREQDFIYYIEEFFKKLFISKRAFINNINFKL